MFKCHLCLLLLTSVFMARCNDASPPDVGGQDSVPGGTHRWHSKPGASSNDTIVIGNASAVFYQPDSLQYRRIRAANDPRIFESMDHELFYQSRNAKMELAAHWPGLRQLTVKNARYLLFRLKDKTTRLIDLDSMRDMCGLLLFDPMKQPQLVDMMNIDSEAAGYFVGNRPASKHD